MPRPAVMLRQASRLVSFEPQAFPGIRVSGELIWNSDGWLELSYGILMTASGGISDLVLPNGLFDGLQLGGERRDELWTTTCCEAFIGLPGSERYWEINLSPNGDWAVYSFEGYRSSQRAPELSSAPQVRLRRWHHQVRLDARLPLRPWWPAGVCPDLAMTAVLNLRTQGLSYWALRHGQDHPDFHLRSTFLQP